MSLNSLCKGIINPQTLIRGMFSLQDNSHEQIFGASPKFCHHCHILSLKRITYAVRFKSLCEYLSSTDKTYFWFNFIILAILGVNAELMILT